VGVIDFEIWDFFCSFVKKNNLYITYKMIRESYYDEELRTDKVWYDSSTVYFSKFVENENDNF
jgi:hypothetical protein